MIDYERRYATAELRVDDATNRKIRGYAVVFNQRSLDLGGFQEIILPEAVDRTLREGLDVRALVDHDSAKIIGRTRAGTLTLRKDRHGLQVEIDPADTTYGRDILESVRRGDVSGMSFGFRTLTDDWRLEAGVTIRDVSDMEIREVSIVSFPAYPQTDVAVAQRSLSAFQQHLTGRNVKMMQRWHKTKIA